MMMFTISMMMWFKMEKKSTIIFPFSPILLSNIPKAVKNPMIPAEQKIHVKAEKNSLIPTKNTCKIVQSYYIICKGHDFTLHFNLTPLKTYHSQLTWLGTFSTKMTRLSDQGMSKFMKL